MKMAEEEMQREKVKWDSEAIGNGKINAEKHDGDERLMAENERRRNREDM